MNNKIYIITGGAGFIGSNLCRNILKNEANTTIYCVDNFSSSNKNNITDLLHNKNFILIEHNIINKLELNIHTVNKIYHLACIASPLYYQKNPIYTLDTCYIGTKNMLELANKYNCRILIASTSEVYGDPLISIQSENYWGNVNPNGLRSCYDEGKRCAESLSLNYNRMYGTNICIIRIFNTYGPYMDIKDGRVITNFITQCLENKDITIYGNGKQTRSFCYISDLIDGIKKIMDSKIIEPINIGNPDDYTILELAYKIKEMTNSKSKIVYKKLPLDDPKIRKPDINKANNLLNWYPKINLHNGLKKTIYYYKTLTNN
jgi:UDP-glucuronate decarboxylase